MDIAPTETLILEDRTRWRADPRWGHDRRWRFLVLAVCGAFVGLFAALTDARAGAHRDGARPRPARVLRATMR
jgi:hypothetical protein